LASALPPKTDDGPERIHAVLLQFRILLRSMQRHYLSVERASGLGGSQLWALAEIAANPGLSVGELARRLAIHLSTASNLVGRMEALGIVARRRVVRDQRVVRLQVTPAGQRALRRAPGPPVGLLQRALLDLPPARLAALHRHLEVLLAHMEHRDARARAALLADMWPAGTRAPRTRKAARRPPAGSA
jgi:DNA-binding MarR family transcriptional regulator